MARGVHTLRQYRGLGSRGKVRYRSELEVLQVARTRSLETGRRPSLRQAFHDVFGRYPSGRDYRHLRAEVGDALATERGHLVVASNDRLFRSTYMPMPTPDGVYDALPGSWRQRSLIGEYWSLIGRAPRLTDAELERELRPFRGIELRVEDPETGRVVRKPFMTRPSEVRAFATSAEARQERVMSPSLDNGGV